MKLISAIEIGYFRSIYKEQIAFLEPMNIFFGRNDSGKSNILRALNLFFNGETNPGQQFMFARDLCTARDVEASKKADARRFVSVKITFNTPKEFQPSLGNPLFVRRTWSISTGTEYNFESSIHESRKLQYLTRFLNRIKYHYIPAIKDRKIFEKLLGQVYEVLSIDTEFISSLDGFTEEIRKRTKTLSGSIKETVGLTSVIAPPVDLLDLFRSLDFETRTELENNDYSLTLQRGDGVQVLHIPTILKFISDESKEPYHIWGFEEPENSLELVNAIMLSDYFEKQSSSQRIQIFMTSHSPAFFNNESINIQRYYVSKGIHAPLERPTSKVMKIESLDTPSELMGETPHLALISSYLKKAQDNIRTLEADRDKILGEMKESRKPLIFVEGDSDAMILSRAWQAFVKNKKKIKFVPCEGTSKMESLSKDGPAFTEASSKRLLFCIVDNDKSGREIYKNSKLKPGNKWVKHNSNGTYWCRLQPTDEFVKIMQELSIEDSYWPFVLESAFSSSLKEEAKASKAYSFENVPHEDLCGDQLKKIIDLMNSDEFSKKAYIMKTTKDIKIPFAEWIIKKSHKDITILNPFKSLIEGLYKIIQENT
jgi:predicted ATP-dependent endonuclease of OLD family